MIDKSEIKANSLFANKRVLLSSPERECVEINDTKSGRIWKSIPGGHKWLDYFKIYDREFSYFVNKSPKILEIGVYKGASLKLWKEFFGEGCKIVGIDIDPVCLSYHSPENNIFVEIGLQGDDAFLSQVIDQHGPFDIIIDDGSHKASDQIKSFISLFEHGLRLEGLYLVEDLECMYWGNTDEYRDVKSTSVDFFKSLVDMQNEVFSRYSYNELSMHGENFAKSLDIYGISTFLLSIRFYQGIVVLEKGIKGPPKTLHL